MLHVLTVEQILLHVSLIFPICKRDSKSRSFFCYGITVPFVKLMCVTHIQKRPRPGGAFCWPFCTSNHLSFSLEIDEDLKFMVLALENCVLKRKPHHILLCWKDDNKNHSKATHNFICLEDIECFSYVHNCSLLTENQYAQLT